MKGDASSINTHKTSKSNSRYKKMNTISNVGSKVIRENTQKRQVELTEKKIKDLEYNIKLEKKKQGDMETNYTKQIDKLLDNKIKLEKDLEDSLKELNERETNIFRIQKNNINQFKLKLEKFDEILKQLETQKNEAKNIVEDYKQKSVDLYNISNCINEERYSYINEGNILKNSIDQAIRKLNEIESSYPKDFSYLKTDCLLQKEYANLNAELINNKEKIKNYKNKTDKKNNILEKIKEINSEIEENNQKIQNEKCNVDLPKLEQHIVKYLTNLTFWEMIKNIMIDYYREKNINGKNDDFVKNVSSYISNIYIKFQNKISNEKQNIQTQIDVLEDRLNMLKRTNNYPKQDEEYLNNQIQSYNELLKVNNQVLQIYESFVIISNKVSIYSAEDIYEKNFINQVFSINKKIINNQLSKEETESYEKLLKVYLVELSKNSTILKSLEMKEDNLRSELEELSNDLNNIMEDEEEYNKLIEDNIQIEQNIKTLSEKLKTRSKNLKSELNKISNEKFDEYLKLNEKTLKNMYKIYGNKMVNKVNKIQKEKLCENIILEHNKKKELIFELISYISTYENSNKNNILYIDQLTNKYKIYNKEYNNSLKQLKNKENEVALIEQSIDDLKEKLKIVFEQEENDIKKSRNELNHKYNLEYYKERIVNIYEELSENEKNRKELNTELAQCKTEFEEKENKLINQNLNLKIYLIDLKMGDGNAEEEIELGDINIKTIIQNENLNSIENEKDYETIQPSKRDSDKHFERILNINKNETDKLNEDIKQYSSLGNDFLYDSQGLNNKIANNMNTISVPTKNINVQFDNLVENQIKEDVKDYESDEDSENKENNNCVEGNNQSPTQQNDVIDLNENQNNANINTNNNLSDLNNQKNNLNIPNSKDFQKNIQLYNDLKPLLDGIKLYKKFGNESFRGGVAEFNPFNHEKNNVPEKCGYGLKIILFNKLNESLEVYPVNNSANMNNIDVSKCKLKCEAKYPIAQIKNMMVTNNGKKLIKILEKKENSKFNNSEGLDTNLFNETYDFIPFNIIFEKNELNLIAPTFLNYREFSNAIGEIIKNKKEIKTLINKLKSVEAATNGE